MTSEARASSYLLPGFAQCIGILLAGIAAYGIYNAYFHPLRKYPGPKLWAAYRLPYVIAGWQGRLPFKVLELHRKYGPVVRIAPDELAFTDAQAFFDIQGRRPDRSQLPKDPLPYGPQLTSTERQILLADDTMHARIRRIYGPAFTTKALDEQAPLILKHTDLFIATLREAMAMRGAVDMSAFWNYLTFDMNGEFIFDESFRCLRNGGQQHFYLKAIFDGVHVGFKIMQFQRYGVWSVMRRIMPKSAFDAKTILDNYTGALVDQRQPRGFVPGKVDVFNYLLQSKTEDDKLRRDELVDNGNVLIIAGSDTTSALLTGTTWYMCKSPAVMRKAVAEVRSAFATSEDITPKSVENLTYLIQVLNEGLRAFPPTPWGWARKVNVPGGLMIAGCHVPEGTNVAVWHWASSRSPANFARPDEFLPERWADVPPPEFRDDVRDAMQAFHVGPRGCLGRNLAYVQMRVGMAKLLWHYDVELAEPRADWMRGMKTYALWRRPALMVRVREVVR